MRVRDIFREDHNDRIATNVRTTPGDLALGVEHHAVGFSIASRKPGMAGKGFFRCRRISLALREFLTGDATNKPGVSTELFVQSLEQAAGGRSLRAPPAMKCPTVNAGGHVADEVRFHLDPRGI